MTKISFETLKESQEKLTATRDFATEIFPVLQENSSYFLYLSQAMKLASDILTEVAAEREFLYTTIIALMLDSGLYDFEIDRIATEGINPYGIDVDVDDDHVKFSIRFPTEKDEDVGHATV